MSEQKKDMKQIIEESFTQYAGAVLQSRALVDVRDCIKPSARQIFYCLYTDKFLPTKPFKKTLKAIGSAVRVYVHGDSSAEGVIMRAAQPFAMRYPLVEVEGNGGNPIESGNWASPRYSAARLSKIAANMFDAIDKDTISEWRDNYDDTEQYPMVLPSKGFYNLVNGTLGIGIGAASSVPQYNAKDLHQALITLLNNPDATFEELYCQPDFATGGYLLNEDEVKESMRRGQGAACKLRAKIDFDNKENSLIVTEIPYGVYTNTICRELEAIVESDENPGIERFNDLTGKTPFLKIYLKRNGNPTKVLNYLWKHTSLQSHFGINFTMLKDGRFPRIFTWKEMLQEHVEHEKIVYRREFEYNLNKLRFQIMINEGILMCLNNIDEVVELIKTSSSTAEAKEKLIKLLDINEDQAKAILKVTLSRLAKLEIEKLINENEQLKEEAAKIERILNDIEEFNSYLIAGWKKTIKELGDDHRTKVITLPELTDEDREIENVEAEDVVVIITRDGGIKRVSKSAFKPQHRNTQGIKKPDEAILTTISTNTIDTLMIFTSKGRLYRTLVDNIPAGTMKTKATDLTMLLTMKGDESVIAATSLNRHGTAKYVIFVTQNGLVKKTELKEYFTGRKGAGTAAIKLREDDTIASAAFVSDEDMLLVTQNGIGLKFDTTKVLPVGKTAMGVKGITLAQDDKIIAGVVCPKVDTKVAIFNTCGIGKKIDVSTILTQNRGGKGVLLSKMPIASAFAIDDNDIIFIQGTVNNLCIAASEVPLLTRVSVGNIMIKKSNIVSAVKI